MWGIASTLGIGLEKEEADLTRIPPRKGGYVFAAEVAASIPNDGAAELCYVLATGFESPSRR
jgi:hypothetical protein